MLKGLRAIRGDRSHGAAFLADAALRRLEAFLKTREPRAPRRSRAEWRAIARGWRDAQPSMGPFLRGGEELGRIARTSPSPERAARDWVRRMHRGTAQDAIRLRSVGRRALPPRACVVTMSRSATVLDLLTALPRRDRPREVRVLRSLPGGEGSAQAADLRARGLWARTYADRPRRRALRGADIVLVGADAVLPGGRLVHKVGTRPLARAAHLASVPFASLADRSKVVRRLPAGWRAARGFDVTPARWVTAYWLPDGVRRPGAVGDGRGRRRVARGPAKVDK
ncbi:MAG TPA: hypothetical protein VMH78_04415 [Thermoplasmata archaeon]|nr:hypothetical protein [Thermoplasmata archaeon]